MKKIRRIAAMLCILLMTGQTVYGTNAHPDSLISDNLDEESQSADVTSDQTDKEGENIINQADVEETSDQVDEDDVLFQEIEGVDDLAGMLDNLPADVSDADAKYQTMRIVVMADVLNDSYGAVQVLHDDTLGIYILQYDSIEDTKQAYALVTEDFGSDSCYLDEILEISDDANEYKETSEIGLLDADSTSHYSWGVNYMGMDVLQDQHLEERFPTVTVAVIDTGIDMENVAFAGHTISSDSTDLGNGDDDPQDKNGHGTRVTGIIADCTPSNVEILAVKIYNDSGQSSTLLLAEGMSYAVEYGADVINLSMGYTGSKAIDQTFLDEILEKAYQNNIVVCCAAGNSGSAITDTYPAWKTDTIAVTAINANGQFCASFSTGTGGSNYGEQADFCAPGDLVQSTSLGGGTVIGCGTSFAVPHITAMMSYLKMLFPNASVSELKDKAIELCDDYGDEGWDQFYGYGCPVFTDKQMTEEFMDTYGEDGFYTIDGQIFYYENRAKVYGQRKISGSWYYFDEETGVMAQDQFVRIASQNKTVYYGSDGKMLYGQQKIGGKWYYFNTVTGAMAVSQFVKITSQNKTVYYGSDGKMLYGQQKISGKWYYFNTVTGAMAVSQFVKIASQNKTVYYGSDGRMVYGWQKIGSKWYYFNTVTGALKQ